MKNQLKKLLSQLIAYPSITPDDAGCQNFMLDYFSSLGFECEQFNSGPVSNFFARIGTKKPLLVFAGHTDVVPVGDEHQWSTPPFELSEKAGLLYGRGTADMKGSLACMMLAAKKFIDEKSPFNGSLGFLITSGEEGDDFDHGTPYVMKQLQKKGIQVDFCIVGEPSSTQYVGDVIKIGRRGSLTGRLTLQGKQGHVAYPHLAENPIHTLSKAIVELVHKKWDEGNEYFPPTSLQITHIESGGIGGNVIPGTLKMQFNFRYSTEQDAKQLKQLVTDCFTKHNLNPEIAWQLNGEPFLTARGQLIDSAIEAIKTISGINPVLSTSGGTSDGRFIAPYGVEVIELGPVNATIHQVNECVALSDLEKLAQMYYSVCAKLIG